jgi:hypothetical protein
MMLPYNTCISNAVNNVLPYSLVVVSTIRCVNCCSIHHSLLTLVHLVNTIVNGYKFMLCMQHQTDSMRTFDVAPVKPQLFCPQNIGRTQITELYRILVKKVLIIGLQLLIVINLKINICC